MTITGLAEKSGLSNGYVSKIENPGTVPPVSSHMTLPKALDANFSAALSEDKAVTVVKKSQRQTISRPETAFLKSYDQL